MHTASLRGRYKGDVRNVARTNLGCVGYVYAKFERNPPPGLEPRRVNEYEYGDFFSEAGTPALAPAAEGAPLTRARGNSLAGEDVREYGNRIERR